MKMPFFQALLHSQKEEEMVKNVVTTLTDVTKKAKIKRMKAKEAKKKK